MRMTLTMIEYDQDDKGKDDKVKNMIVHLASTFMLTAPLPCCHLLLSEYTPSSPDAVIVIIIILPDVLCSIAVIIILLAQQAYQLILELSGDSETGIA